MLRYNSTTSSFCFTSLLLCTYSRSG